MNVNMRELALRVVSGSELLRKAYNRRSQKRYTRECFPEDVIACAEKSEAARMAFLKKASEERPTLYEKKRSELRDFLNDFSVSADQNEQADNLFCMLAMGFTPDEYYAFHLKEKTPEERKEFYSMRESLIDVYRMNDCIDRTIYSDKTKTYSLLHAYYGREAVEISSDDDYPKLQRFLSDKTEIVWKDAFGEIGKGVKLIPASEWTGREREFFEELRRGGKALLEERIVQSEDLARLNRSSVNTVRLIAYHTRSGVEIPFCFLKIGREGSFVDNVGGGGMLCSIDPQTGVTNSDGFSVLGDRYEKHPDSGETFLGFRLPEFEKALELCRTVMEKTPRVRFVGWDFAHTPNGWVIVEGNSASQLRGPQLTRQAGLKKQIQGILGNMDLII